MSLHPFGKHLVPATILFILICLIVLSSTIVSLTLLITNLKQEYIDQLTYQYGTTVNCTLVSKELIQGRDCLSYSNSRLGESSLGELSDQESSKNCDLWWVANYLTTANPETTQSQTVWFSTAPGSTGSTGSPDPTGLDLRLYSLNQTIPCRTTSPEDHTSRHVLWSPDRHTAYVVTLIITSTILVAALVLYCGILTVLLWQYHRGNKVINLDDNKYTEPLLGPPHPLDTPLEATVEY